MKSPATAAAARLALRSARAAGLASSRRPVASSVLAPVPQLQWRRALTGRANMSTVVEDLGNTPSPPPPPPNVTTPESVEAERQANAREILKKAVNATAPRNNWTKEEISAIYYHPLMDLAFQAVSAPPPPCHEPYILHPLHWLLPSRCQRPTTHLPKTVSRS